MTTLKQHIMDTLTTVEVDGLDIEVYQSRPSKIEKFPCITFYISDDVPMYTLDKQLNHEVVEVTVDIWTRNSRDGSLIKTELEEVMRESNFRLVNSRDVPDPDEKVRHIINLFNFISS